MVDLAQTRVVIRAREIGDLCDLALAAIRRDGWSLLRWWLLMVIPYLVVVDSILVIFFRRLWEPEPEFSLIGYAFLISVAGLTPLSLLSGLLTLHLGMSVFVKRPTFREVWRAWISRLGYMLLVQLMPFASRGPAIAEIVLLERLVPTTREGRAAIRRRLTALASYGLSINQLGAFFALLTFFIIGLTMAGMYFSFLTFETPWRWGWALVGFQLGACIAGGFNRVVRFFLYLNSRIKYEGWDVELAARAAAQRLLRTNREVSSSQPLTPPTSNQRPKAAVSP
ncbi:MAG: hypothetical protein WBH86_01070 [Thermogutta sp.]|nr:hypothetical protein [Thermogutta sp.]HOP78862.1 hypothetical protein [Thermogutta sp.]HPU06026.1 hypothetical protein [Thermogutta sp.]